MTNIFAEVGQDFEVEFNIAIKWVHQDYIIVCCSYKL